MKVFLHLVTGKKYVVSSIEHLPGNMYYRGLSNEFVEIDVLQEECNRLRSQLMEYTKLNCYNSSYRNTYRAFYFLAEQLKRRQERKPMKLLDKVKSLLTIENLDYRSRDFGEVVLILYGFSTITIYITLCLFILHFIVWSLPPAFVVRTFIVGIFLGISGIALCSNLPPKKPKH